VGCGGHGRAQHVCQYPHGDCDLLSHVHCVSVSMCVCVCVCVVVMTVPDMCAGTLMEIAIS